MSVAQQFGRCSDGATGAIHAARIKTQCGTWERHDDNEFQDKGGSRIQIKLISVTANAIEVAQILWLIIPLLVLRRRRFLHLHHCSDQ